MSRKNVIDLERIRNEREKSFVRWLSLSGEFKKVNEIMMRRAWRDKRLRRVGNER